MNLNLLSFLSIFILAACGSNSDITGTDPGDSAGQISQSDYNELITPCADESNTVSIPAVMSIMDNYIQYEATAEIFSTLQFSKSLLTGLSQSILPPPSATYADVNNLFIFPDTEAYEWKVGEDTYRYTLTNGGYEISFLENSNLLDNGSQLLFVEQSEDCSKFEYNQYAIEDDGDEKVGDIIFRYQYIKSSNGIINISFGTDLYSNESEYYSMRSRADLSGDMTVKINNKTARSYLWQSDGSGSYTIIENDNIVNSGNWSF